MCSVFASLAMGLMPPDIVFISSVFRCYFEPKAPKSNWITQWWENLCNKDARSASVFFGVIILAASGQREDICSQFWLCDMKKKKFKIKKQRKRLQSTKCMSYCGQCNPTTLTFSLRKQGSNASSRFLESVFPVEPYAAAVCCVMTVKRETFLQTNVWKNITQGWGWNSQIYPNRLTTERKDYWKFNLRTRGKYWKSITSHRERNYMGEYFKIIWMRISGLKAGTIPH